MIIYTLGQCKKCGKHAPLKNGYCRDCEKSDDTLNSLLDIFDMRKEK
jgi:hypothetical protein